MLTLTIKVNEKAVIDELIEYTRIRISTPVLKRLIRENPVLVSELSETGIDSTTGREVLLDAMVEDLKIKANGGRWPMYADGKATAFFKALELAVKKKKGYSWEDA